MKFHRICLICRQIGIDKALAVGKKSSLGNLITHLMSHPKENKEYAKITAEAEESVQEASKQAKDENVQAKISFPMISNVKETFLNVFSKWTVEEFQPFNVGESRSFKGMIQAANPKISPPDTKTLKRAIWDDIRNEIITIRQQEGIPDGNAPNNERATTAARPSLPAAKRIKKKER